MPGHKGSTPRNLRAIAEVGDRQHGAIATRQLRQFMAKATISRWVDEGRLHPRHRGVYALGHPRLSDEGRLWAALLATNGTLDAETAAWAWRILDPHPDPLHIVSATKRRATETLTHRRATPSPDAVVLRGLQTLNLHDTLAHLPPKLRQRAEANAGYAGLLRRNDDATDSPLEDLFWTLIRAAGVQHPKTQRRHGATRPDFVWPDHRLIVEIDGGRAHDNPYAFHADRRRDAEALTRGWRTVRFTRRQLENEPEYVIATLRALLAPVGTIA